MCTTCKKLGSWTMVPSTQMEHFLGVRKGAWTEDEDILLRKCIKKYGEGNWRHVPSRAGLNRCRKSCRLRWMNYLHPKIKRGEFSLDEIDLIVKMHRLLGNRWSLIAGRLPGRTANDIKNYWNTYINKRFPSQSNCTTNNNNKHKRKKKEIDIEIEDTTLNTQVIKPQPRTLSKNFQTWHNRETMQCGEASNNNSSQETSPLIEKNIPWWESILFDKADGEEELLTSFAKDDGSVQQGKSDWDDLFLDNVLELWDK